MDQKPFRTGDVYLSTYLSLKLTAPDMVLDRGRVLFTFAKSDDLYQMVYSFNSGTLVDVREYTEALKALKASMYSLKSAGVR